MVYLDEEISFEFRKGYFVVRGTDKFWSGVSPDLCIEQTLMTGLKGATGLTRGRSLTEQNRLIWVLSRPAVVLIDTKIKEMTDVHFSTPEQHLSMKHVPSSTFSRNSNDMNQMMKFCKSRYLLDIDAMSRFNGSLKHIATVENLALDILSKMATASPCTYTMYLYHVPIPCTYTMYLYHVPIPCTYTMYLYHVPIPCTYTMYLYHVPIPCTYTMYLYHVPIPCTYTMYVYHVPIPCTYTMYVYHVPIPCTYTMYLYNVPIPCTYTMYLYHASCFDTIQTRTIETESFQIDSGLFFQRILSTCSNSLQDLSKASLFDDSGFLRDPSKHELGNLIRSEYLLHDVFPDFTSWDFVVDGGLLLYSVPWNKGFIYDQIIDNYVNYIRNMQKLCRYPSKMICILYAYNMHIVFYGYLQSNTKDHTHERRNLLKSFGVEFSRDFFIKS